MGNINQNEDAKVFADNLAYYMKLHKLSNNLFFRKSENRDS